MATVLEECGRGRLRRAAEAGKSLEQKWRQRGENIRGGQLCVVVCSSGRASQEWWWWLGSVEKIACGSPVMGLGGERRGCGAKEG